VYGVCPWLFTVAVVAVTVAVDRTRVVRGQADPNRRAGYGLRIGSGASAIGPIRSFVAGG
jgi:hypothetical protein